MIAPIGGIGFVTLLGYAIPFGCSNTSSKDTQLSRTTGLTDPSIKTAKLSTSESPKRCKTRIIHRRLVCGIFVSLFLLDSIFLVGAVMNGLPSADLTNSIGMRFRIIPPGDFLMGALPGDTKADDDEHPQHLIAISRVFLLGQFEVSQAEYRQIMERNPSRFQPGERGETHLHWWTDPDNLPVEMVSWYDAVEFCERLSALPAEVAAGRSYRLPTEAEWEYACRAGKTTRYHFGEIFRPGMANMNESYNRPLARGSFPPNGFGLYDMHGNVLEWCEDWHDPNYYAVSPETDPQGPQFPDEDHHVLRGGGWAFPAASCSFRDRIPTQLKGPAHGFRVVCEMDDPALLIP
ncbi:Serine/threonine-protein kinase pkn1 [Symmachiella macrocystis]|uniref:Serine/threonine-protein kinase pkn1 n=1 Tax=Symmachiella macrocystis TaxID=2527985 RepID=A0A5C6BNX4_9PLAN|nr:formylglycine-generating enzyme family protein [Symmachiella macrocystis]TWU13883.1 Serine/threonine-protein kinase pkn1 [Symmachiella macrocystis]